MSAVVLVLRNSERQTFKKCRHQWSWTWLAERQAAEAPHALRFGDLIHQALAAYYKPGVRRGPKPATTFERLYNEQAEKLGDEGFNVYADEKWESALGLGIGMLEGYVEQFKDADAEYEVISSERTFRLTINHPGRVRILPHELPRLLRVRVVGTLDGLWRHRSTGRFVFKEFKTASAITEDGLAMDEQASLYWTYGPRYLRSIGALAKDEDITAILYTFLRKSVPNDNVIRNAQGLRLNKPTKGALMDKAAELGIPFAKKTVDELIVDINASGFDAYQLGEVSKTQEAPFFHRLPVYRSAAERRILHERVLAEAVEIATARAGGLALYKNPGPLHMPNCRGCPVREPCEVHEAGGDWESVFNATMVPWEPLAAHELPERK